MANVNRPKGFTPVKHSNGSPFNGQATLMFSDSDNLFKGDLVKLAGDGVARDDGLYMNCDRVSAAGDTILGVVIGWEANPDNLNNLYHPASSTYGVFVADARDLILEAQADDAIAGADIGLNVSPLIGAGSTSTGVSNFEVDSSTKATTNTLTLTIVGAVASPDNETNASDNKVLVKINEHQYADQIAGV
jgi:hypothetical protein